jgi:2-phospho-L-lactate guanylyltransferase (CobY/MobA/RfbA family)
MALVDAVCATADAEAALTAREQADLEAAIAASLTTEQTPAGLTEAPLTAAERAELEAAIAASLGASYEPAEEAAGGTASLPCALRVRRATISPNRAGPRALFA